MGRIGLLRVTLAPHRSFANGLPSTYPVMARNRESRSIWVRVGFICRRIHRLKISTRTPQDVKDARQGCSINDEEVNYGFLTKRFSCHNVLTVCRSVQTRLMAQGYLLSSSTNPFRNSVRMGTLSPDHVTIDRLLACPQIATYNTQAFILYHFSYCVIDICDGGKIMEQPCTQLRMPSW